MYCEYKYVSFDSANHFPISLHIDFNLSYSSSTLHAQLTGVIGQWLAKP